MEKLIKWILENVPHFLLLIIILGILISLVGCEVYFAYKINELINNNFDNLPGGFRLLIIIFATAVIIAMIILAILFSVKLIFKVPSLKNQLKKWFNPAEKDSLISSYINACEENKTAIGGEITTLKE
ncbi:unnamed protein product, partial [marine sediment metagenome]